MERRLGPVHVPDTRRRSVVPDQRVSGSSSESLPLGPLWQLLYAQGVAISALWNCDGGKATPLILHRY
jgi:hypothetical protein